MLLDGVLHREDGEERHGQDGHDGEKDVRDDTWPLAGRLGGLDRRLGPVVLLGSLGGVGVGGVGGRLGAGGLGAEHEVEHAVAADDDQHRDEKHGAGVAEPAGAGQKHVVDGVGGEEGAGQQLGDEPGDGAAGEGGLALFGPLVGEGYAGHAQNKDEGGEQGEHPVECRVGRDIQGVSFFVGCRRRVFSAGEKYTQIAIIAVCSTRGFTCVSVVYVLWSNMSQSRRR